MSTYSWIADIVARSDAAKKAEAERRAAMTPFQRWFEDLRNNALFWSMVGVIGLIWIALIAWIIWGLISLLNWIF